MESLSQIIDRKIRKPFLPTEALKALNIEQKEKNNQIVFITKKSKHPVKLKKRPIKCVEPPKLKPIILSKEDKAFALKFNLTKPEHVEFIKNLAEKKYGGDLNKAAEALRLQVFPAT